MLKLQIGFLRFLNYGLRKTRYRVVVCLELAIAHLGLAITTFYGRSGGGMGGMIKFITFFGGTHGIHHKICDLSVVKIHGIGSKISKRPRNCAGNK